MSQRVSAQPAWILHRRAFRDSSLILDLLTREHGVISLVARSGRKSRSASLLQVFQPLSVDFVRRGELGTLTRFEADGSAIALQGRRLWCGFYINELSLRLMMKDQPDEQSWRLYRTAISHLLTQQESIVLRHFEYQLLEHAGYGIDIDADINGQAVDPEGVYHWHPNHGLQRNAKGVKGQVLLNLVRGDWSADVSTARPLLSAMLEPIVGNRPLKTATMLRELSALRGTKVASSHGN